MDWLVEELFANIEAFLWVGRSLIGGRLRMCSIDQQGEAIEIDSQIIKLRQFTRVEEEMSLRRTNPERVEQTMEDFKNEMRNKI